MNREDWKEAMYRPQYSALEDKTLSLELIKNYPLGLFMTHSKINFWEGNYFPFYIKEEAGELILVSHMAKSNPQWKTIANETVMVCFQGPNRYISPTMYISSEFNVPTWSYAVVQVRGSVEFFTESVAINQILNEATHFFESSNGTDWIYDLPSSLQKNLETAIVGIKIKVGSLESKFKLNQNRNKDDYNSVIQFLKNSPNAKDQELLAWMLKTNS